MFFNNKKEKEEVKEESYPTRKIIDGILYDTSRAEQLCVFQACGYFGLELDPYGFAILFRGRNGKFFVQHFGKLLPCQYHTAKKILGNENVEKYIEIFGEVEEA